MKFQQNPDFVKNQALNLRLQNLSSHPVSPVAGQIYFDTSDNMAYVYNGTSWDSTAGAGITLPLAQSDVTGLVAALAAKATPADITTAITSLVNSAPTTLDTLKELSDALGSDANFSTTVSTSLGTKAPINNPTFTGTVTLPGAPTVNLHAATKLYVDTQVATAGTVRKFSQTIGDGSTTSIVVTHNLGAREVVVQVFETGTPWGDILPDIRRTSTNTITLIYPTAPASGEHTVVVTG